MEPVCPPAPKKRCLTNTTNVLRRSGAGSLQDEPACARSLSLQDGHATHGPALVCPWAPVKKLPRFSSAENFLEDPDCLQRLQLHGDSLLTVNSLAQIQKKKCGRVSLSLNRGVLPRPFQSQARRNILKARAPKNVVRVMGAGPFARSWVDLDEIHRFPLNRAGNPAAPPAPRKPKCQQPRDQRRARLAPLKRVLFPAFGDISSDSETESFDSGYTGNYGQH